MASVFADFLTLPILDSIPNSAGTMVVLLLFHYLRVSAVIADGIVSRRANVISDMVSKVANPSNHQMEGKTADADKCAVHCQQKRST